MSRDGSHFARIIIQARAKRRSSSRPSKSDPANCERHSAISRKRLDSSTLLYVARIALQHGTTNWIKLPKLNTNMIKAIIGSNPAPNTGALFGCRQRNTPKLCLPATFCDVMSHVKCHRDAARRAHYAVDNRLEHFKDVPLARPRATSLCADSEEFRDDTFLMSGSHDRRGLAGLPQSVRHPKSPC
jgi:hypothetical protein